MIRTNEESGEREFISIGLIETISEIDKVNDKGDLWRSTTVKIKYPNGHSEVIGASLQKILLDLYPNVFKVGERVEVAIQLDGEYAGNAKLQLETLAKADVSMLVASDAPLTTEGYNDEILINEKNNIKREEIFVEVETDFEDGYEQWLTDKQEVEQYQEEEINKNSFPIAEVLSWIYLFFIILMILQKGVSNTFSTIGWIGDGLITIAIIIVIQSKS
ncbi:hypothetical protein [Polaribacter ponticola]|uniref:Uncharacterized protein n=1 Tax=Polaribacter ponticola TaxID=2978475 RepID=A0ABT5S510_9FLAO|nr:hypothetical protein [Polaribacter sp. MSW5]MDD7913192.1 hypothetical protein [Polaribacter sp. MSW5]